MSSAIVLIIGAGGNIGRATAKAFAAKGYKVAVSSRSNKGTEGDGYPHFPVNASDPASISDLFAKVKQSVGPPSVVIYNAASGAFSDAKDPLSSVNLEDFNKEFNVNATSPLFSAKEAVKSFSESTDNGPRTFIFTGNIMNVAAIPALLTSGMGKSAAAHLIHSASVAYKEKGYRFYYGDERNKDGSAVYNAISGEAHADLYVKLAEDKETGNWQQTFVKGIGYVDFSGKA